MQKVRSLTLAGIAALACGSAQAGVYTNNFDSGIGAATVDGTTGFPPVTGTYFGNSGVQLVDAVNGRFGSLQVPDLDAGQTVQSFTATIGYATPNVQTFVGGTNPDPRIRGTGLGLFFGQYTTGQDMDRRGPIPGLGSTPPGTPANGLSIEMDTIEDTSPSGFRIYVDDVLVASNTAFSPAGTDIRGITVTYSRIGATANGTLTLSYNNNTTPNPVIFSSIIVPFVPQTADRFSINGSNDNDVNRVWITDANLQTVVPEPTALAGLAAVAGLALRRRSR